MCIMRQIKKLTWLQACFLGDLGIIWYNSLGDSLFQIYVMNFVEIVIDHYFLTTSHVSHVLASCTHYTSYSLLGTLYFVWPCCGHPRLYVPWFWCKMCLKFANLRKIEWKTCLWKIWVEFKCFWKTFHLILMHFIHNTICFEEFLH